MGMNVRMANGAQEAHIAHAGVASGAAKDDVMVMRPQKHPNRPRTDVAAARPAGM
jgi:hypothetical protein